MILIWAIYHLFSECVQLLDRCADISCNSLCFCPSVLPKQSCFIPGLRSLRSIYDGFGLIQCLLVCIIFVVVCKSYIPVYICFLYELTFMSLLHLIDVPLNFLDLLIWVELDVKVSNKEQRTKKRLEVWKINYGIKVFRTLSFEE